MQLEKFTERANKTQSKKRIVATRYLGDYKANELLKSVLQVDSSIENIMFTLVCFALSKNGLMDKQHVQMFIQKYSHLDKLAIYIPKDVFDSKNDVLGFVYQSLLTEGERNISGQYYTCKSVVEYMIDNKVLSDDETFLDPCCCSGAFLMAIKTSNPFNLYGFDINIVIENLNMLDKSIIRKMESLCNDKLSHSLWALGIVTGDNKNKVKKEIAEGLEPIYTGKDVKPFKLQDPSSYILFNPKDFQQCAKEEYFRAPEKLIYRFIAKYPIVAYDNKQCLCLNSANILIPSIDTISIKSVAALLNSTLYRYYYSLKFSEIKVLKGNLQKLPFPKLTKEQDEELSTLVSNIQENSFSEEYQQTLDKIVYSIFAITEEEQKHICTNFSL